MCLLNDGVKTNWAFSGCIWEMDDGEKVDEAARYSCEALPGGGAGQGFAGTPRSRVRAAE
jgi:hypothetical protein